MLKLTRQTLRPPAKRPNGDEVCVVFLFPDSSAIRYLARPPLPGASVRSPWGDVWRVRDVVQSGHSTYTVRCGEHARAPRQSRSQRPAAILHALSNRLAEISSKKHLRWRVRNYLP